MTVETHTQTAQLQIGAALEALHVMRPVLSYSRGSRDSQRRVRLHSEADGPATLECHTDEASIIVAMHEDLTGSVDVFLDAERLTATLESLGGTRKGPGSETIVTMEVTDNRRVAMTTATAARAMPVMDPPAGVLDLPPADASMVLDRKKFSRAVSSAAVCAERGIPDLPLLAGAHLEDGTVTCTDRYRLAQHDLEGTAGTMPASTLPAVALSQVLKRMTGDTIGMGHRFGCVTIRDGQRVTYTQRAIVCEYPRVQKIIGTNVTERPQLDLDRKAILAALKPYGTAGRHVVVLTPTTDGDTTVTIRKWSAHSGAEDAVATETIPGSPDRPERPLEHAVAFNSGYLAQILRALEGKTVTLRSEGPLRPAHLTSERPGRVFVLQPVRQG